MPLAGLVLNRVQRVAAPGLSAVTGAVRGRAAARRRRRRRPGHAETTAGLLRLHAAQAETAARHQQLARRVHGRAPGIPVVEVPAAAAGHPRPRGSAGGRRRPRRRVTTGPTRPRCRAAYRRPPTRPERRRPVRLRRGGLATGGWWGGALRRRSSLAARADSNRVRQERMSGRRLSRARRSRSVMPPHTPNSVRLSRASARHSAMTGHAEADRLGLLLGGALHEQRVGVRGAAGTALGPVLDPAGAAASGRCGRSIVTVTSDLPWCACRRATPGTASAFALNDKEAGICDDS